MVRAFFVRGRMGMGDGLRRGDATGVATAKSAESARPELGRPALAALWLGAMATVGLGVALMRPSGNPAPPRAEASPIAEQILKHPVTPSIAIPRQRIVRVLWLIMAGLFLLGVAHMAVIDHMKATEWWSYLNLLALDGEQTLPAWFSSMMMAGSAVLCFVASRSSRRFDDGNQRAWLALALIFLAMSFDEVASVHERVGATVQKTFDFRGFLYFSWVVIVAPLLVLGAVGFARFLRRLPPPFGARILIAGLGYVTGALGCELIGAAIASDGERPFWFWVEVVAEELLEMSGLILFIGALLDYLAETSGTVTLDFSYR